MTSARSTKARSSGRHSLPALATLAVAVLALILGPAWEPEPDYPEWATLTRELESSDWPLVLTARYDAANHFVLVDIRPGVSSNVALRLACESVLPRLDRIDPSVGFALYETPDRVVAHRDECATPAQRRSTAVDADLSPRVGSLSGARPLSSGRTS